MSVVYELQTPQNEPLEVGEETAEMVKQAIRDGRDYVEIGDNLLRVSGIMAVRPSQKNHPEYQYYLADKNNYGYRGGFEAWCDESGVSRRIREKTEQKELPPVNQIGLDKMKQMKDTLRMKGNNEKPKV